MLTPPQKIKQAIIKIVTGDRLETPGTIEAVWEELDDYDHEKFVELEEAINVFRCGEEITGLASEYNSHYSTEAVAAQMLDGSWVGFTHYFGGGKHSNPREMEWIAHAYAVTMEEVPKIVKVFTKVEPAE